MLTFKRKLSLHIGYVLDEEERQLPDKFQHLPQVVLVISAGDQAGGPPSPGSVHVAVVVPDGAWSSSQAMVSV